MRISRNSLLLFGLLVLNVFLAYSNYFENALHTADIEAIGHAASDMPSAPPAFHPLFAVETAVQPYAPALRLSLMADHAIAGGLQPFWFRVSTFLTYVLLLAFVFSLFRSISESVAGTSLLVALSATAFYGLHPVSAEILNSLVRRGELYATLGVVAGLVLYARSATARRTGLYLLPVAVAALSNPIAFVFPLLLLGYDFLILQTPDRSLTKSLIRSVPAFAVSLVLYVLTVRPLLPGSPIFQPYVALRHVIVFLIPTRLSALTGIAERQVVFSSLLGLAFVVILLFAVWRASLRSDWRPVGFGLWWFIIAAIPASVLCEFVGLSLAGGWTVALLLDQTGKAAHVRSTRSGTALSVLAALLLVVLATVTRARNEVWHSEESYWFAAAVATPGDGKALMNYGLTQLQRGNFPRARTYLESALTFLPDQRVLQINLGIVEGRLKRDAEAESHFRKAIALSPGDLQARFYYEQWQNERAVRAHGVPKTADEYVTMSLDLFRAEKFQECIAAARQALLLDPGYAAAYNNIAAAYQSMGQWDEAIEAAGQALRIKPDFELARNNLAWSRSQKEKQKAAKR